MFLGGGFDPDRYPHHPAIIELRWAHKGLARLINCIDPGERVLIERIALEPRGLVADTDGLQFDRRQYAPVFSLCDLFGKPLGIVEIAAQARTDRVDTIDTQVVPEF